MLEKLPVQRAKFGMHLHSPPPPLSLPLSKPLLLTSCMMFLWSRPPWMRISRLTWKRFSSDSLFLWYSLMATWFPVVWHVPKYTEDAYPLPLFFTR